MKQPRLTMSLLLLLSLCLASCGWGEKAGFARFVELEDQIRAMHLAVDAMWEEARVVRQMAEEARAAWVTTPGNHHRALPTGIEQALEEAALAESAIVTAAVRVMAAEITAGWTGELWPEAPFSHHVTSPYYLNRVPVRIVRSQFAADKALQHTDTAVTQAQAALAQARAALE